MSKLYILRLHIILLWVKLSPIFSNSIINSKNILPYIYSTDNNSQSLIRSINQPKVEIVKQQQGNSIVNFFDKDSCDEGVLLGDIILTKEDIQHVLTQDTNLPHHIKWQLETNCTIKHVKESVNSDETTTLSASDNILARLKRSTPKHQRVHRKSKRAVTALKNRLWDYGVIPYEIDSIFDGAHKTLFMQAMRHWENFTCITFVERNASLHDNWVIFTERPCGCCSFVGKRGSGSQALSVGKNCDKFGIVIHEIGHVVGFWHEHTRPDRDRNVIINYENILSGQEYNFKEKFSSEVNSLGEPYDFGSIMHYARNTFARSTYLDTILPRYADRYGHRPEIGQRAHLSPGDIRQANILYKCTQKHGCGGTLFNSFGYITSPDSVANPNSINEATEKSIICRWRISGAYGQYIVINVTKFHLPSPSELNDAKNCGENYLMIRNGYYELAELNAIYCGQVTVPISIQSNGPHLWIEYKATIDVEQGDKPKGFIAQYEIKCGGTLISDNGVLRSPNYPFDYLADQDCSWILQASPNYQIAISFQTFEIENHDNCVYDFLEVRDGSNNNAPLIGRFCGYNLPNNLTSTGNQMFLHFKSDTSVQKGGFSLNFFKESDECLTKDHGCHQICINTMGSYRCECKLGYELGVDKKSCEEACGGLLENTNGTITSPSFPEIYPPRKICLWQIVAPIGYKITLNFTHFDLEGNNEDCEYDKLEIRSGNMDEPDYSYLHGNLCGPLLPLPITSENNVLYLKFSSDNSVQNTGFSATYNIDKDECAIDNGGCQHICQNLPGSYQCLCHDNYVLHENKHDCKEGGGCYYQITSAFGKIISPNWPSKYPKRQVCYWNITTLAGQKIKLDFNKFEIEHHQECAYDHLRVYDGPDTTYPTLGKFCGSKSPSLISSGNNVVLLFESDSTIQKTGFIATYSTVCGGHLISKEENQSIYSHAKFGDSNYDIGQECDWHIIAPKGYKIELTFTSFELESNPNCTFDYVQIMDGPTMPYKFCGKKANMTFVSARNRLRIHFVTDDAINSKGFHAIYRTYVSHQNKTRSHIKSPESILS